MRAWPFFFMIAAGCGDNIDGNRAPTVELFSLLTFEDLAVTRTVSAVELDLGDVLVASISLDPENGNATTSGLAVTYVPGPDFHGSDQFVLTVSDGTDQVALPIDVTVESVPDRPFGTEDALATNEDMPRTVSIAQLLSNDSDPDGDPLKLASVGNPIHGVVSTNNGNVTFMPAPNFNGMASFIYTVSDGSHVVPTLVTIVVGASNDPPTAGDDSAFTDVNTPVTILGADLLANDTDPENQILTVASVRNESNGTLNFNSGDPIFTPNAGFSGTASFEYLVSDGIETDVGLVTITVNPP